MDRLDLINVNILVVTTAVSIFIELDVVVHAFMTVSAKKQVSQSFISSHTTSISGRHPSIATRPYSRFPPAATTTEEEHDIRIRLVNLGTLR